MVKIEEYILLPKTIRQAHLRLHEPCIERGGESYQFKGLLAHILNTTIPKKKPHLCHACNNGDCGNPYHMYWGTPKENIADAKAFGSMRSPWEYKVAKHGEEKARQLKSEESKAAWANHSERKRSTWHSFPEDKRNEVLDLLYKGENRVIIATKTGVSLRSIGAIFFHAMKGTYGPPPNCQNFEFDKKKFFTPSGNYLLWIRKDLTEIKINDSELSRYLTDGWERGRIQIPITVEGRWMTKDKKNTVVRKDKVAEFLADGWVFKYKRKKVTNILPLRSSNVLLFRRRPILPLRECSQNGSEEEDFYGT